MVTIWLKSPSIYMYLCHWSPAVTAVTIPRQVAIPWPSTEDSERSRPGTGGPASAGAPAAKVDGNPPGLRWLWCRWGLVDLPIKDGDLFHSYVELEGIAGKIVF